MDIYDMKDEIKKIAEIKPDEKDKSVLYNAIQRLLVLVLLLLNSKQECKEAFSKVKYILDTCGIHIYANSISIDEGKLSKETIKVPDEIYEIYSILDRLNTFTIKE